MKLLDQIAATIGYSETDDCGIDALIDYKNALEDMLYRIDSIMLCNNGHPKALQYRNENDLSYLSAADVTGELFRMGFGEPPA